MSAIIPKNAPIRQLDKAAEPDRQVTEDEVKDVPRLQKLLMELLRDVATLKRRWWPNRIDYEDRAVGAASTHRFTHNFKGRVRWWVVDWVPDVAGDEYRLERDVDATDANTLVLRSDVVGTITLRVEEVG